MGILYPIFYLGVSPITEGICEVDLFNQTDEIGESPIRKAQVQAQIQIQTQALTVFGLMGWDTKKTKKHRDNLYHLRDSTTPEPVRGLSPIK